MRSTHRLLVLLPLLAMCVVTATSCSREHKESAGDDVPVFVISIDTLRSDHLPAYGYKSGSTPALDAFRRDSVMFSRAFSHVPLTLPSHASILTGLLPSDHGVRDNMGYTLEAKTRTIATILKERGYSTGAAVSTYVLRGGTGINQGFDFYDDTMDYGAEELPNIAAMRQAGMAGSTILSNVQRNGERTEAALERWIDATSNPKLFALLHLYEPHAPYTPPPQFAGAKSPYDGEVSYADSIVGKFLDHLKTRGLYDKSMIVILSDHGEGLGEHGEDEHGIFLYRYALQVPLLVKLPGQRMANSSIPYPVALVDVVPTILRAIHDEAPVKADGVDLFDEAAHRGRNIYAETYYTRIHLGWSELTSLIADKLQYIEAPRSELYDYVADPGETRDVRDANRRDAAALRTQLQALVRPFEQPKAVDPEDQRKLSALGYIGSTSSATGSLPDPKDRIETAHLYKAAMGMISAGRADLAIDALKRLLEQSPDFADAWSLLAEAYRRVGRSADAIAALKTALQKFPHNPHVAISLSQLLYESGQKEAARQHAEIAAAESPVLGNEALAQMAIADHDLPAAEKFARVALDAEPGRTTSLLLVARTLEDQQRFGDALGYLDRCATEVETRHLQPIATLQLRRGTALLHEGRVPEAETAFKKEVELFPNETDAWGNLAMVVAAQGRLPEVHALLNDALARNPNREMLATALQAYSVLHDAEGAAQIRDAARARGIRE